VPSSLRMLPDLDGDNQLPQGPPEVRRTLGLFERFRAVRLRPP